jgi:hypothetical protein
MFQQSLTLPLLFPSRFYFPFGKTQIRYAMSGMILLAAVSRWFIFPQRYANADAYAPL